MAPTSVYLKVRECGVNSLWPAVTRYRTWSRTSRTDASGALGTYRPMLTRGERSISIPPAPKFLYPHAPRNAAMKRGIANDCYVARMTSPARIVETGTIAPFASRNNTPCARWA